MVKNDLVNFQSIKNYFKFLNFLIIYKFYKFHEI